MRRVNECSGDSAPRESVLPSSDIRSGVERPWSPIAPLCTSICSPNVLRCSGVAVISVFCERAPKIHREAFATTETSLGEPCRVPKGRLKLVPRPRWSLGVCRPILGGRLPVSGAGPGSPVRKGVRERLGVSRLNRDASRTRPDVSLVTLALRGIFRVPYWAPFGVSVIR
ncbi:hypothetical protein CRG98_040613 [Punica granatum]|uniref:Uncharacterized protein n=1 Tax=Punica granatum TaxID=22663 RepID=A0A2I0I4W3_PUNGR|nr:hypothetical protein CRG98_040613 [Punica granatum]